MRHPLSNDKVIIKRSMDGHYVYFSVRDDRDNGSIIDFVQNRQKLSIGAVRKELRPWIGQAPMPVPEFPVLHKTEKDRMKVEMSWVCMEPITDGHPYLEHERAIPGAVLTLDRFATCIRSANGSVSRRRKQAENRCRFMLRWLRNSSAGERPWRTVGRPICC
jgi:hypothetical protein